MTTTKKLNQTKNSRPKVMRRQPTFDGTGETGLSSPMRDNAHVLYIISRKHHGKEEFLPADTVVYSTGMKAKREETEKLRSAAPGVPVYEVGDCVSAAKVYDAIRQAFVAAMSIL